MLVGRDDGCLVAPGGEAMFDRENAVGFLLLGFCAVVAGVLIYSIQTGTQFRFTGPSWLGWAMSCAGGIRARTAAAAQRRQRWT